MERERLQVGDRVKLINTENLRNECGIKLGEIYDVTQAPYEDCGDMFIGISPIGEGVKRMWNIYLFRVVKTKSPLKQYGICKFWNKIEETQYEKI